MKTITSTKYKFPWMTVELKSKMKHRNRLYKLAKRTGSLLNYSIYRSFRNNLSSELKNVKQQFILNKLKSINDSATLWRELSSLGLVKLSTTSPFNFYTPQELMDYYQSVISSVLPCTENDLNDAINYCNSQLHCFELSQVDHIEVRHLILTTVSGSHSIGPDNISPSAIKLLAYTLAPILTQIVNHCINLSMFPTIWKKSHIKPLSKVNLPTSPKDIRPIANLSELSKIFEKIILNQINKFLDANKLCDPHQSGYKKHHSTQTALLMLSHDVRLSADKRRVTILVLFDFSKAFDTVSHRIL